MATPSQDFVERMGLVAEQLGMPRIAGRMIGFLLLDGGAHSLDDLADRLQVSKASISTNARQLESLSMIRRETVPGDRRDFYRIGENPGEHLFELSRQRLDRLRALFCDAQKNLTPDADPQASERLAAWSDFYDFVLNDLDHKVERWRNRRSL